MRAGNIITTDDTSYGFSPLAVPAYLNLRTLVAASAALSFYMLSMSFVYPEGTLFKKYDIDGQTFQSSLLLSFVVTFGALMVSVIAGKAKNEKKYVTPIATKALPEGTKKEIVKAVKEKVWTEKAIKAQSRLVRAQSLGQDSDPTDDALVSAVENRTVLVVNDVSDQMLSDENMGIAPAVEEALARIPESPTDSSDKNAISEAIKKHVATQYWTDDVTAAQQRIADARRRSLDPNWNDVAIVRNADKMSRLVAAKMMKTVSDDTNLDAIPNLFKQCQQSVEQQVADSKKTLAKALHDEILEKVTQYVWTSHPDLCVAKGKVESGRATQYDVDAVMQATAKVLSLHKHVRDALITIDGKRKREEIFKNYLGAPTRFWSMPKDKLFITTADITFELIKKVDSGLSASHAKHSP